MKNVLGKQSTKIVFGSYTGTNTSYIQPKSLTFDSAISIFIICGYMIISSKTFYTAPVIIPRSLYNIDGLLYSYGTPIEGTYADWKLGWIEGLVFNDGGKTITIKSSTYNNKDRKYVYIALLE